MGCVYILHFDTPLAHARHYVGHADQLKHRIKHHQNGTGARITQVCCERGIGMTLARTFENAGYDIERKLKQTHNIARYCPICHPDNYREYKPRKEEPC